MVAKFKIAYPAELPISARRAELLQTIGEHQVVIVAGETGSGKSTQLPKLCLELGRGADALIGHTQPRRIAARSIAERVAEELGTKLGGIIGYKVRFTDQVGGDTMVKVMTDGILLAEIQRDRNLSRYDTIIVDEAHERSLNVDFLLGYLHQLLPRRPDLKLIITSATIDTERFATHFGDAPVVSVAGRTYPIETRYRPLQDPKNPEAEARDQPAAICDAVAELMTEGDGDILVFCSGEREIRDAVDALTERKLPDIEILPLYARLSPADQHRVFAAHRSRRVVVATNVAETSVTVPGVRYVVDSGTARISRYSQRTKVQRLPIEAISQASANQRSGRCGRIAPGVCIRLYSGEDFDQRPEFTEPEIQRTNLASVILQMAALDLGEIESFPFLDPPDSRNIRDGIALLEEVHAIVPGASGRGRADSRVRLMPIGRKLARLPLDPRLGRMLIAADDDGCLTEALIITAGLSIRDPRERPVEKRQAADESHARFVNPDSDFLGLLNLWEYVRAERRSTSSSRFRRTCRAEYLNYNRIREWQDVHAQLRQTCDQLGMRRNATAAEPDIIHRALLTGLISHVGTRNDAGAKGRRAFEYRGARNAKFAIAPGSAMFDNGPRWVMAAELTETTRLWARVVTRIKPEWVEQAADHLVKRSYTDPHWDRERGAAMAKESVTLYGLPLIGGRAVMWGRIDRADARDLFIRHALIAGEWENNHEFVSHNRARTNEVREMEARLRRSELLVDDETLVAWFGDRIPPDVTSVRHFERWWRNARTETPELLHIPLQELIVADAQAADENAFPSSWQHDDLALALSYEFDPASPADGVTIDIPVGAIDRFEATTFEWLVPGLRAELVTALVRSMPKQIRKEFLPIPETVEAVLPLLATADGGLLDALRRELGRRGSVAIPPDAFDLDRLPLHLRPNFRIVREDGRPLAHGGDLDALKQLLEREVRASLASSGHELEQSGLTDWTLGELPGTVETTAAGHAVVAYPALVDEGESVGVRLLATADEQHRATWAGLRRLLLLNRPGVSRTLRELLTNDVKLTLVQSPYPSPSAWFEDLLGCAVDQLMIEGGAPVWSAADWRGLVALVQAELPRRVGRLGIASAEILRGFQAVEGTLAATTAAKFEATVSDVRAQLDSLVYPGFLTALGARNLDNLVRYLKAMERRLSQLPKHPQRDRGGMLRVQALEREYERLAEVLPWSQELEDVVWQLQEMRVSLFAQSLGTPAPVSEKRIRRALEHLAAT